MKQFLAAVILALVVISALIEARPGGRRSGGRGRSGKSRKCQSVTPCDLDGQTLDDCKDGSTCTSDPVALTLNDRDYNVKVCVPEGETTNNITKALIKKACEVGTGSTVESKRTCRRGDACTGGPISFFRDGDIITATFCQDNEDTFDLEDFLEDLGERRGRSSSEEDSSESEEDATTTTSVPLP